jgi:hypothetical protein
MGISMGRGQILILSQLNILIEDLGIWETLFNLLALHTFTGGVPKYIELFCDNSVPMVQSMIEFMICDNSPFIDEGKNLLIEEFGKNYATYIYRHYLTRKQ